MDDFVMANTGDRPRTIWTPSMNRYYLDLVVEHVRKGNMSDHALRKQVWAHMTACFNKKFGFQYDKDILKNHFKSLRRTYNDITTLLNNGFRWDAARHMVVGDENMWDTYLKAHPDKRSYRTKITPFYNELCVIYGEKVIDMGHNEDMEEEDDSSSSEMSGETPAIGGDSGYGIENSSHVDEEGVLWGCPDEGTDIDFCEVENDDHSSEMPNKLNGKVVPVQGALATDGSSGIVPTGVYRSRVSWTPPMDSYFIDLLIHHVCQGNKIGRKFSKEAWMHMIAMLSDKFGAQYDKDVLYSRYKALKKQYVCISSLLAHGGFEWDETLQMVKADPYVWDEYIKAHPDVRQYRVRPVPYFKNLHIICGDANISGRNINENSDQSMINAILEMASAVTSLAEKSKETSDSVSVETWMAALRALPDIDEELFLDACDFLEVDVKRAKTFVVLDAGLRKKWLMRKLRSS